MDVVTTPDPLEPAIEAAMTALKEQACHERQMGWICACGASGGTAPVPGSEAHRHLEGVAIRAAAPIIVAQALRDMADEIDRGPTFALPPSVISELVRERAETTNA